MNSLNCVSEDVKLGENVRLAKFVNLYGCEIGAETKIGAFVEIQKNASVGKRCKISSHSFVCEGVKIEDNVFVGHGVMFINDTYPRATTAAGELQNEADWSVEGTVVGKGASIGSNATILCNVSIGTNAIVGAGSVVTKDVPPNAVVAGNPARILRFLKPRDEQQEPSNIPFLDLVTPHVELEQELVTAFRQSLKTASFVGGPIVEQFEESFANFSNCRHSIAVNSGTDALRFALIACGIEAGSVVLTVPNTFIATAEAISQARAIPEFIDVDERTYNMSVQMLERYLEKQCVRNNSGKLISLRSGRPVAAILPVHLYGQMAEMDGILDLADRFGLVVIEDACQAHGAEYFSKKQNKWLKAGSVGHAAAFSFYPGKNLGACGEGGAATTNDPIVASKIRMLRDHGQSKKYIHEIEGYNGRLDAVQAAILSAKLPRLAEWNELRRQRAEEYNRLLATNDSVICPYEPSWSRSVYHLYVIRTHHRDGMIEFLKTKGIGTGIHYPVPLHQQRPYAFLNYTREDLPVASSLASEIISLPMFPQLTRSQQTRVVDEVSSFTSTEQHKQLGADDNSVMPLEGIV